MKNHVKMFLTFLFVSVSAFAALSHFPDEVGIWGWSVRVSHALITGLGTWYCWGVLIFRDRD